MLTLILLDRPLIRGDGVAYLAWIDTIVLDQDVNLNNQHDRLHPVITYQIEWSYDRERWVNIFPFGIAFLQAPFHLVGHNFNSLGLMADNPDYFYEMQGLGLAYSFWLMIGANLMTVGASLLTWYVCIGYCEQWFAALVAYVVFLGTPLIYYSTISPVNSHNPGAFAVACMIALLVYIQRRETVRWFVWAGLGIAAGLMILSRWQLTLVAVPVWSVLVMQRQWRGMVISSFAAATTLLPLPLIWSDMFGVPFLVPFDAVNDEPFIQTRNYSWEVLRETIHHSPIVLLSLFGVPFLWCKDRMLAVMAVSAIALQVYVNGSALDWNAGESYGMRRMSELYIVYALLLAAFVGGLIEWGKSHRIVVWAVHIGLVVVIGYSLLYLVSFLSFTWTNPDHVFSASPEVMINYFVNQPDRFWILWEVYRTHIGPLAWSMPGA